MSSIAETKDKKEAEVLQKDNPTSHPTLEHTQSEAAKTLQRTYRGHRERRQLQGLSLDPASRWTEAIKEAQYRALTTPHPRTAHEVSPQSPDEAHSPLNDTHSGAHARWSRAGKIALRANTVEDSSLSSSPSSSSSSSHKGLPISPAQRSKQAQKRQAMKQARAQSAKMMDLSYFLEMVDVKHRYGSNLRKYHAEWQRRPTRENFFYWLDYGEGAAVELPNCSRERLERMQVRYLGREERRLYEVVVGEGGKLVWRKDGVRVDTTREWRDSVRGIVRVGGNEPEWAHDRPGWAMGSSESSGVDSDAGDAVTGAMSGPEENSPARQTGGEGEGASRSPRAGRASQPASPATEQRDGKKHSLAHDLINLPISPLKGSSSSSNNNNNNNNNTTAAATHRKDEKDQKKKAKKQMWIFLADTKMNLYVGIKQSGAFQHSSFLHGSKVSAAGTLRVRDGQLRILQPRSGHYKTSSRNLRLFVRSLRERGVDMSTMAVGGSYAAMVGVEAYMKTKGGVKGLRRGLKGVQVREKGGGEEGGGKREGEKVGDGAV